MKNRETDLRRYYRDIRSYLPCSRKQKRRILDEIRERVNIYLEECPEADYDQIEARFGTPQTIAAAYVDDMNTSELLTALGIRRKFVTAVIVGVLALSLIWGIAVSIAYVQAHSVWNGYLDSYITYIE